MTKKLLGISLLATSMMLAGCTSSAPEVSTEISTEETSELTTETIHIVASSFHEYDWLTQIIGEDNTTFDVSLLIDSGVDLHSYEPTVDDIATITSSDLFIYNGGESDAWAVDILDANPELNAINVIEVLDDNVQMSVVVEGMEADDDHDHDDETEEATEDDHDHDHDDETEEATEDDHDHDHDDETEEATEDDHDHDDETEEEHSHEDEHIWLSLENAMIVCEHFADVLSTLDSENAELYATNAQNYIAELESLDEAYEEMIESAARDTIIVTDRFPFLYLASDYDINYYAAFEGCSAETEASFETIVFLAEKADEYDVNYLLITENGLESLATTVISSSANSEIEILELDSMQSVTQEDIDAGVTYYSIMESNLEVLRLALSE